MEMMRKNILGLLLLLLTFASKSLAQESKPPKSSLLWKITGKDVQESYLFGTMHLIEKEYFVWSSKLEKLVKKSEMLVMELPGLPDQSEGIKYITLEEGSFFDYFTAEQKDTILDWVKTSLHLSEQGFNASMGKYKPFAVVSLASQLQFMGKTESYEMRFEQLARKNNVDIAGLETMQQQMAIFDSMSREEQADWVMESIRNKDRNLLQLQQMQQIYQKQQIDSLYQFMVSEGGSLNNQMDVLLDERNQNWIPQLLKMMADKKCFVAVGAGHLGGDQGVIRLLRNQGLTVEPVAFD
jgi:uncharacterized protein YbaP (TraB family)